MPTTLSLYYTNFDNKQDVKADNLIIPLPEGHFLVHESNLISLYDTKNNLLMEKNDTYKKITFNPIFNTLFCVKECTENDQISRTLDELTLKDLSPVKTNIPIPFLTPTWLDEDRWLGFSGPWLIIYNHKIQQEETQSPAPVMNIKSLTTLENNSILVDSGYQTTVLQWENQTLSEVPESKKEHPFAQITTDMIAPAGTNSTIKKIIQMPDDETLAILTSEGDNSNKIHLMNTKSQKIHSTFSFEHDIEDMTAVADNHIVAIVDHACATQEVSRKVTQDIITSIPSTLSDPGTIISDYVGNNILYPHSLFRPQLSVTHAATDPAINPNCNKSKRSPSA